MILIKYRLLASVRYIGTNYIGWQKQLLVSINSIQEILENCLSIIANHSIHIVSSSRTDAGVHSIGQLFHFDTYTYRLIKEWLLGVNSLLPNDILLNWIYYIPLTVHVRKNTIFRRYIYIINNNILSSCFLYNLVFDYPYKLDINLMLKAASIFKGIHDFSFFSSDKNKSVNTIKHIMHLNIFQKNKYIIIDIQANSFLYRMVRNIVSSLLLVGIRYYSYNWIYELLNNNKNKCLPIIQIVKSHGLYLYQIGLNINGKIFI